VGRKCKERTPGERSGLEAGQEKGYVQICMEIPHVNLDTGRLKRTTKQASKQARNVYNNFYTGSRKESRYCTCVQGCHYKSKVSRDSVVGIATRYELDGPAYTASCTMGTRSFLGKK
jgi:hypothetical protein